MPRASKYTDRLYVYILEYLQENLSSPTYKEIMQELGIASTSTVSNCLRHLEKDGKITIRKGFRGIRVEGASVRLLSAVK